MEDVPVSDINELPNEWDLKKLKEEISVEEFRWNLKRLIREGYPEGIPLEDVTANYRYWLHKTVEPISINSNCPSWGNVFRETPLLKQTFIISSSHKKISQVKIRGGNETSVEELREIMEIVNYTNMSFVRAMRNSASAFSSFNMSSGPDPVLADIEMDEKVEFESETAINVEESEKLDKPDPEIFKPSPSPDSTSPPNLPSNCEDWAAISSTTVEVPEITIANKNEDEDKESNVNTFQTEQDKGKEIEMDLIANLMGVGVIDKTTTGHRFDKKPENETEPHKYAEPDTWSDNCDEKPTKFKKLKGSTVVETSNVRRLKKRKSFKKQKLKKSKYLKKQSQEDVDAEREIDNTSTSKSKSKSQRNEKSKTKTRKNNKKDKRRKSNSSLSRKPRKLQQNLNADPIVIDLCDDTSSEPENESSKPPSCVHLVKETITTASAKRKQKAKRLKLDAPSPTSAPIIDDRLQYDNNYYQNLVDTPCNVCRSPEANSMNRIIFCNVCNVSVHQVCYGITRIPSGPWVCQPCSLGLIRPECNLCPKSGGAMKSTSSGRLWVHVSCAIWIPEVKFRSIKKMNPIRIKAIPDYRRKLSCMFCEVKIGACIRCCRKNCEGTFHITCALKYDLLKPPTFTKRNSEYGILLKRIHCGRH